jgi:pimeloyl-ACP methyl ester carboxylesterase
VRPTATRVSVPAGPSLEIVETAHHDPPRTRRLTLADGRVLQVRDWPGDGRPIVFLHGLLACGADWHDLATSLPHRCLAIDLPGFGGSDPPRRARLSAYAGDVAQALRQLGVGAMTLVGHSLGGGVATAVAEQMRSQVRALVLLAPAGYGRIALAELAALPLVRTVAVRSLPHIVARSVLLDVVYASFVTGGLGPTDALRRQIQQDAASVGPGVRVALEALAIAGRSRHAFHRRAVVYSGPVSAVWGGRDVLVPAGHARALVRALPQARTEVWRGMGHHPQRERPGALQALVRQMHQMAR